MKSFYRLPVMLWLISIILPAGIMGQAPDIAWAKTFGGSGYDDATSIQLTADGGYIAAGNSSSTDGDVTGNHGLNDIWLVKVNAALTIEWQRSYGGTHTDEAKCISQTADGGYIIAGNTMSVNGDVNGNHGSIDYLVIKTDANGTIIWQKCFGGTSSETAYSIEQTIDGGYIVAGSANSIDGQVTNAHGSTDAWLIRLNAAGNIIWQHSYGGSNTDFAQTVKQTTDGGFIFAGFTYSNDGDVSGLHGSYEDGWIVKTDSAGIIEWQRCAGGTDPDRIQSIIQTADGKYIAAGSARSNNGDVSGNHGDMDAWVIRLTGTGMIDWQKCFGGTSTEWIESVSQTSDGGYVAAGTTYSNNGDVAGLHGSGDYWVIRIDAAGNLLWQKASGGSDYDFGAEIIQSTDDGYVMGGSTSSNNGDVHNNHGGLYPTSDFWLVKLNPFCTPLPAISIQGSTAKVCPGDFRIYFAPLFEHASYNWTVPAGATITGGAGTRRITLAFDSSFTTDAVISVDVNNGCTISSANRVVQRRPAAKPSVITGPVSGLCGLTNQQYSVLNSNGTTYNWTVPAGTSITNGQGTSSILVDYQALSISDVITVTATNTCGTSAARTLRVRTRSEKPAMINGSTTVCPNTTEEYTITPVSSAISYTWIGPAGSHIIDNGVTSLHNSLTTASTTVTVLFGNIPSGASVKVKANNNCGSSGTQELLLNCCLARTGASADHVVVTIYPNPFSKDFSLQLTAGKADKYLITITDLTGKEVYTESFNAEAGIIRHDMDLQNLNDGIYFMTLFSSHSKHVIKLIKE